MAKLLTPSFPEPAAIAVASYSYTDIAEGTGTQIFYGANASGAVVGPDYFLQGSTSLYSDYITTYGAVSQSTFALIVDKKFDVEFNLPKDVKGRAYVSVPFGGSSGSVDGGRHAYVFSELFHYDGTTETSLASGVSGAFVTMPNEPTINTPYSTITTMFHDITAQQHFAKGDKLRCNVKLYAKKYGADASIAGIIHDPMSRDEDVITNKCKEDGESGKLQVHIPFILDV